MAVADAIDSPDLVDPILEKWMEAEESAPVPVPVAAPEPDPEPEPDSPAVEEPADGVAPPLDWSNPFG